MAVPDRTRRLSDGVLVDASLQGRLLGIRLLTVDATVVLAPADAGGTPPAKLSAAPPAAEGPRERTLPRPSGGAWRVPRPAGRGLAEAVRSINEGAELLAASRRDGAARPRRSPRIAR
jgi:hypothetical protein